MQLRDSAHRARADRGTGRQLGERPAAGGDERVARVLALRDSRDVQARVLRRGQILVRVDRKVDLIGQQPVAQGGDEDPDAELAALLDTGDTWTIL